MNSQQILWILYVGAAIVMLPLARPEAGLHVAPLQAAAVGYCCFNTLAGYGAFAAALEHLGDSRVSAVLATGPTFTFCAMWVGAASWPWLAKPSGISVSTRACGKSMR